MTQLIDSRSFSVVQKVTKDRLTLLKCFSLNFEANLHFYGKLWFFLKAIEKRSCQMKQQEPVDAVKLNYSRRVLHETLP